MIDEQLRVKALLQVGAWVDGKAQITSFNSERISLNRRTNNKASWDVSDLRMVKGGIYTAPTVDKFKRQETLSDINTRINNARSESEFQKAQRVLSAFEKRESALEIAQRILPQ